MYPTYPAAGSVFRDATMNPQYPVRTLAGQTAYSGTGRGGSAVDQQYSRVWTTGGNVATVHRMPAAAAASVGGAGVTSER